MKTNGTRKVARLVKAVATEEGEGFIVNRPLPSPGLRDLDPFLVLDEMGPIQVQPGEAKGAPAHPHRGFETVTYVLSGEFEHRDSSGHQGVIKAGDVQWMTAGRGVIHSEMPSSRFQKFGGEIHGFQLWVNLPKAGKMMAPRYQDVAAASIPEIELADLSGKKIRARVISGKFNGAISTVHTVVPVEYIDFQLDPGAMLEHSVPGDYTACMYVVRGKGSFGSSGEEAERGTLVVFERGASGIKVKNAGNSPLRIISLAGKPIGEPIVQFGPFVMNTVEELEEAFWDFQSGNFVKP